MDKTSKREAHETYFVAAFSVFVGPGEIKIE